jgi:signal transduction histidine kinase
MIPADDPEGRFLVLAPSGRDAPLAVEVLGRAGVVALACPDMDALCKEAEGGVAGVLIAEEALTAAAEGRLIALLERQPPWSDLAVVLFTAQPSSGGSRLSTLARLVPFGNVTLLDRPLRPVTLASTARAILRSRLRQYAARAELQRQADAVRQRDQFLAMLGHELRNPLNAISLAVTLLGRGAPSERLVAMIERQTRSLERLVDDLLQVSRVTTGKVELRRERVDLRELVARTLAGLEGRRGGRTITLAPATSPAFVDGDPVRLEQIVVNLLSNAIKYTRDHGRIDVRVDEHAADVELRVTDDGVGIPPHVLPKVFDLFVQADEALDRSQGGLGIGLTLVKALVELHGGTIEATSPGAERGSTFVVRLPRAASASPDTEAAPREGPAARRRVLLVEDDADARELTREVLVAAGHDVTVAADGVEGAERALALRPDVVFVDIGLPRMDGYEVARRIRQALGATIRLVALTGYGQPTDRERADAAGFDRHLTKPIGPGVLERTIEELTGRR